MTVSKVKLIEIDSHHAGQRIDNFLLSKFSNVPKSRIYRALRRGEVRVNKGRVKPVYRIQAGDLVRLPPLADATRDSPSVGPSAQLIEQLEQHIIHEDEHLLVINKPAGIAVHSGTGDHLGVIEVFRASREHQPFMELAHRIDKQTSGCLVIAKSRRALIDVQQALHADHAQKDYVFLVKGQWRVSRHCVSHALEKQYHASRGAKMVANNQGKCAQTIVTTREIINNHSLMTGSLLTGRTHQIRVHVKQEGHPIAGDDRYGDYEYNRFMQTLGLKRMFLHAEYLKLPLAGLSQNVEFYAPLPAELDAVCNNIRKGAWHGR